VKTLFLLRHAKSSWGDASIPDHDRPLAARGERAVRLLASHISDAGVRPALVLCSSARRARDTLDAVATSLGNEAKCAIEDDLYGASAHELLVRLRGIEAAVSSVLVVGHNPGLHDLAIELCSDGDRHAMAQLHNKFPTGALARIDLGDVEWHDLGRSGAYLTSVVVPRELT
jgi:phosphohistidine phosphatase